MDQGNEIVIPQGEAVKSLDNTSKEVLRALLYYDIFRYPLQQKEIEKRVTVPSALADSLAQLCRSGLVRESDGFYFLGEDEAVVARRKAGNEEAAKRMKDARRYSRLIGNFPFVRGVMLSGSISKGYLEKDGDIDYFIITEPGRLWIARTFLIMYKKIFLLNSRRNFCVNYFIDHSHLEIPDKNIFTATEAVTLIPAYSPEMYQQFCASNEWAWKFFPGVEKAGTGEVHPTRLKGLKWLGEKIYGGRLGNWLDEKFMRMTVRKWQKKFPDFDSAKRENAMRSRKYVSKHHPQDFQTRVLTQFSAKIREFESRHNFSPGELNG